MPTPTIASAPRTVLTRDEIDGFDRDGFHIHEVLFSPDELSVIADACERVAQRQYATGTPPDARGWEPEAPPQAVCKIDNAWKSDPAIAAAVTDERIGHIAAQLVRANGIRLWHDQYLRKPAAGGKIVTWHQDWMFWQCIDRCRTVTCWIALADVTSESGPMLFLAGSHHLGLQMQAKPGDWTGEHLSPPPADGQRVVPVVMRAGQVSFHHGLLMHGSDRNHSDTDRVSLVTHVMADDCAYRPGMPHVCEQAMRRYDDHPAAGEPFRGPQFPYAWREDSALDHAARGA
ncbi:MAG: phytanoyl-CoA dioxygenase family protein [Planctomycetes bacterium]|nr:phytanoyl-CoA dioxygenase family protein [Planctomycetota bacterium]